LPEDAKSQPQKLGLMGQIDKNKNQKKKGYHSILSGALRQMLARPFSDWNEGDA